MLQDRDPLNAAGGRQGHAGQPPAVWPAVPARRLWALRSARCRVTEGPAARCESTRSRSMRARMCARRLTRPSSMTMRSASARASGFLLWSFPRRARAAPLPTSRLARPRCGHPSQPRRLRRSPEDAPLRPAAALVNRTSPADGRGASSAGGTRHGPAGAYDSCRYCVDIAQQGAVGWRHEESDGDSSSLGGPGGTARQARCRARHVRPESAAGHRGSGSRLPYRCRCSGEDATACCGRRQADAATGG